MRDQERKQKEAEREERRKKQEAEEKKRDKEYEERRRQVFVCCIIGKYVGEENYSIKLSSYGCCNYELYRSFSERGGT